MRKRLIGCGIVVLVLGLASSLYAGGIINKQNLSADYIRTLNRNAATDSADAVAFNPAGTAMMQNGLYLRADAVYLLKDYSNKLPSAPAIFNYGTLDSNEPSLIPGLFAVYKQDRWAAFFGVTIPGGGGFVDFKDGNARTVLLGVGYAGAFGPPTGQQSIEAESYYIGYSIGGSYKIFDSLSIGGGVRYVDAYQKFKGSAVGTGGPLGTTASVKIEREDQAWNYFLGLNYAPIKDLNIALTYMSNTQLNFKADTRDNTTPLGPNSISSRVGWVDGTHEREDLPGYIAAGVSYFIIPGKLRIEPNVTYYLEKEAKWEGSRFQDSDSAGNSYDIGVTLEYILNPQWKFSVGYLHTEIMGMNPNDMLPEAPELDANTLGLGLVWSPLERLDLTLGACRVWYESEKTGSNSTASGRAPAGTEYDKDVWGFSFGVQYRFF
jgi:long-chain fatty acid transport protein